MQWSSTMLLSIRVLRSGPCGILRYGLPIRLQRPRLLFEDAQRLHELRGTWDDRNNV